MKSNKLKLTGSSLTIEDIYRFINSDIKVELDKSAISRIKKSRALVDKWVDEEKVIYGVTTGFGEFSNVSISKGDM
ncbi:MAG: aromatic amino acid lyase [Ignavibacteriaceae bacterium]|nr:aromatic amino acid lyase [Ignavibacteriaceae bacterium]